MQRKTGLVQAALLTGVGIIGSLLGISVQQYWTVQLEHQKSFDSWRREAYVSYLSGIEKYRLSQEEEEAANKLKVGTPEQKRRKAKVEQLRHEWKYDATTAARKIAVFGNSAVIEAIARHWSEQSQDRRCADDWKTELALFRAMREQAVPKQPRVTDDDLALVAMGCIIPKE
jgi:hypothetical protein